MNKNTVFASCMTALGIVAACAAITGLLATAARAQALASGECNENASVELMDMKRGSGVLTAKVVYTATADKAYAYVHPRETYVLDAAGGKKYEVLTDSDGNPLASSNTSYSLDKTGDTHKAWYKFPAPPAEVTSVSLTLKNCEPLEDVAITDK